MIANFYDRRVILSRLKTTTGDRKAMSTTATVDCGIQEMDRVASTQIDQVQNRAWIGYFEEGTDIKEGDLIRDNNSDRDYIVLEVTDKDYYSTSNKHLEVILTDSESDE